MKFERLSVPHLPLPDLVAFNATGARARRPLVRALVGPPAAPGPPSRHVRARGRDVGLFRERPAVIARSCSPTSRRCRPTSAVTTATPVQTFARERRVELSYDEYPPLVVHAFISAEDKTFFSHGGIDYPGLIGAVFDFTAKSVTGGGRAKGGSTITQQVAKYLLQDNELHDRPQDPRGDPRLPARIDADQAADPRALSQLDLPRPQRLRRAGRQRAPISTRTSTS